MAVRGIRGAITAHGNSASSIVDATNRLLRAMVDANSVDAKEIASVFFTTTPDLTAEFPAAAARKLGWGKVPLLCSHEMDVPNRLHSCIRVLMLVNTDVEQSEVRHVYLEGATRLRPDISGDENPETAGSTF